MHSILNTASLEPMNHESNIFRLQQYIKKSPFQFLRTLKEFTLLRR